MADPVQQAMENDHFWYIRETERVANFMLERVKRKLPDPRSGSLTDFSLIGMFLRALAWMQTVSSLANPVTFQAIGASNRALMEILTDCAFLANDVSDQMAKTIEFWENSAKLKSAETLTNYFKNASKAVPKHFKAQEKFCAKYSAVIISERKKYWGDAKHPDRWTKRNLHDDVVKADKLMSAFFVSVLGKTLTEVYKCEYQMMNWHIHGSGLASIRNMSFEAIENTINQSRSSCADLAMAITKIVIDRFKLKNYFPEENDVWDGVMKWQRIGLPEITFSEKSKYPANPLIAMGFR